MEAMILAYILVYVYPCVVIALIFGLFCWEGPSWPIDEWTPIPGVKRSD